MREKAVVFEETCQEYLDRLSHVDLASKADILGVTFTGDELVIPFYGENYGVSSRGVRSPEGVQENFAINVVLFNYILRCPGGAPDDGKWLTYRDFKGSGPLTTYFTNNLVKIIESTFEGRLKDLESALMEMGGVHSDDKASYDLSMVIGVLPRIPVFLRFNDRDDMFPAGCSILFRESADSYLDMESLAIAGTFLAGRLIYADFSSKA